MDIIKMSLLHLDKIFERKNKSQVSCGGSHTAFLTKRGKVYMCGAGTSGQLGTDYGRDAIYFTKLDLLSISQISCGESHTAFLTKGGDVYMCGDGKYGQLGTGDRRNRLIPTKLTFVNLALEAETSQALSNISPISQVSCGEFHTAFLTKGGDVYMCGGGTDGQLGIGDEDDKLIPTKLVGLPPISQVSCGESHTAFLTKGGDVYMCGNGTGGRLGTGDEEIKPIPTKLLIGSSTPEMDFLSQVLTNLPPFSQVSCGTYHTAFLTKDGDVYMCGGGMDGQLGTGDEDDKLIPTKLLGLPTISHVACGAYHTAFLTKDGEVHMCGAGSFGQLGTGGQEDRLIPTRLLNLPPIYQVSCGGSHTALLFKSGVVYTFGNGENGRLGTSPNRLIPTKTKFGF